MIFSPMIKKITSHRQSINFQAMMLTIVFCVFEFYRTYQQQPLLIYNDDLVRYHELIFTFFLVLVHVAAVVPVAALIEHDRVLVQEAVPDPEDHLVVIHGFLAMVRMDIPSHRYEDPIVTEVVRHRKDHIVFQRAVHQERVEIENIN